MYCVSYYGIIEFASGSRLSNLISLGWATFENKLFAMNYSRAARENYCK